MLKKIISAYFIFAVSLFWISIISVLPSIVRASNVAAVEDGIAPDTLTDSATDLHVTSLNATLPHEESPGAEHASDNTAGVKIEGQTPELKHFWNINRDILPWDYAYVLDIPTPVYKIPVESTDDVVPVRMLDGGSGTFRWVSLDEPYPIKSGNLEWFRINPGEYVESKHLKRFWPSDFHGINLREHPLEGRYGWIVFDAYSSTIPGRQDLLDGRLLKKHTLVKILETRHIKDWDWHRISEKEWLEQRRLAQIRKIPRPEGIPPGSKWIDVNLYEQTIAAYQGDDMIYVSLVSSGLPEFETEKGLFRIWAKVKFAKMGGGEKEKNYYWLEDVPYHMYFSNGCALHGAYWHNNFGVKQSHGCVNISCLDARWFFDWTLPKVPGDKWIVDKKGKNSTWVWVHD